MSRISSFLLLALLPLSVMAIAPRTPSGSPSCYHCPGQDQAQFGLGENSNSGGVLFCSYPAFAGENPNDFFCTYNSSTGTLITDNDAGFCPGSAPSGGCATKRDDNLKAAKRHQIARAAQPQTSNPKIMSAREALSKKKRSSK